MKSIVDWYKNESGLIDLDNLDFFKHQGIERNTIHKILSVQNQGVSKAVKENIDKILDDNTYVIITGQQLGLLGGPLYTIYKMLNTVQLAKELSDRYPEKQFIPIFWLESEDADFEEVASLNYLDKANNLGHFTYSDSGGLSIANREFNQSIDELNNLFKLNSKFKSGEKWYHAFYSYFKEMFDEFGIVTFRSNDDRIRENLEPYWQLVLKRHSEIKLAVQKKSEDLEKNDFKLQFKYRDEDSFIFMHTDSNREKINDISELDTKMRLSPNAILRPLMQDYIFPTISYIAGPGEIAYHMQITDAYSFFNRKQPLIYPRTHVTILNSKTRRLIDKYNLTGKLNLADLVDFKKTVLESTETMQLEQSFSAFESSFKKWTKTLLDFDTVDNKSRDKVIIGTEKRLGDNLKQVEKRLLGLIKRKNIDLINHTNYLTTALFPNDKPQERIFPIVQFHHDVLSFSKLVLDQVDILNFDWQFIKID